MITAEIEGIQIEFVPAGVDPAWVLGWVAGQEMLGFDVETGGPDPLNPFHPDFAVRLISFAARRGSVLVLDGSHRDVIREVLQGDHLFVAHNGGFDSLAVRAFYGVAPTDVIDTFLLALLVHPPSGDDGADDLHALKPLSVLTGSTALVDAETALHGCFAEREPRPDGGEQSNAVREWEGRGFATVAVDDPRYWIYNGLDSVFGLRVLTHLLAEWEGDDARDVKRLLALESELNMLLTGVTWRGLRVDRDALGALFRAAVQAQEAMAPAFAALGVTNPRSGPDLSQAFEALGALTPARSEAGQISTDKMEGMPRLLDADQPADVRRLAQLLLEFRGHQGLRAKTREIADLVRKGDGHRVHPRLNALKARTGRMSIQDPALQNLPKNDPRIRAAFLAEDGMVLVGADFSQVEFRVAAALSEDAQMIAAVRSGMDLHNFTATQIFGADFTPEQRGQAKNTGFCIQYGGGGARVARMTGLSHQAADKMIQKFFATYPGLQQYIARVSKKDVVKLPSRRRATVDPSRTYANLNYYVQGTARDIFADALLRLRDAGWGEWLWLVVHDEIILQVPLGQEQAACAALEAAMNTTFLGVPITADAKVIGPRWGHLPEPEIKEAA